MTELVNLARIQGDYIDDSDLNMEYSLSVQMVNVAMGKTADHMVWGSGPLTYTITVSNDENEAYTDVELIDTLDADKVDFVEGSLTVAGSAVDPQDYEYNPTTGMLTTNIGQVAANSSVIVTFQVTKKTP